MRAHVHRGRAARPRDRHPPGRRGFEVARRLGCTQVWLTTTNDNLDAIRFYQRRGFRLARIRVRAVDRARQTLKPEIPPVGAYGIPMRDELDLERELD